MKLSSAILAVFLTFSEISAKQKETIIVEADDYDYTYGGVDARARGMVVFDPFEGLEPGPDGQFVGNDAGGQPIVHKMCGQSPIPVIVCNGCSSGFPRYTKPCNQPDQENQGKFKCGVKCGPGFKPSIKRMKCIGSRWKKLPANGKVRCVKDRTQRKIFETSF